MRFTNRRQGRNSVIEECLEESEKHKIKITKTIKGFENANDEYPIIKIDFDAYHKNLKREFNFKVWTYDSEKIIKRKTEMVLLTLDELLERGFYSA